MFDHYRRVFRPGRIAIATTALLAIACSSDQKTTEKAGDTEPTVASPPLDLRKVVQRFQYRYRASEAGWSADTPMYSVRADAAGFSVAPSSDEKRQGRDRATFSTVTAHRGNRSLIRKAGRGQVDKSGRLIIDRGDVAESLRNDERGVEQSWLFVARPEGEGDVTVRVAVSGYRHDDSATSGLRFVEPNTGTNIHYSDAVWIDAHGKRTPVRSRFDNGAITLRVPQAVVEGSTYPAVLDPIISPEFASDTPVIGPAALGQEGAHCLRRHQLLCRLAERVQHQGRAGFPQRRGPGRTSSRYRALSNISAKPRQRGV